MLQCASRSRPAEVLLISSLSFLRKTAQLLSPQSVSLPPRRATLLRIRRDDIVVMPSPISVSAGQVQSRLEAALAELNAVKASIFEASHTYVKDGTEPSASDSCCCFVTYTGTSAPNAVAHRRRIFFFVEGMYRLGLHIHAADTLPVKTVNFFS